MPNVYDVIDMLREGKYLSMRALARLSGISSTTMASIMSRKPKDVSLIFLEKVAKAFDVDWREFYGREPEIYEKYGDSRVSSFVTEEAQDAFLYNKLGSTYYEMRERANTENYRAIDQALNEQGLSSEHLTLDEALVSGILAMMKELNSGALQEMFTHTLGLFNNENCRK